MTGHEGEGKGERERGKRSTVLTVGDWTGGGRACANRERIEGEKVER